VPSGTNRPSRQGRLAAGAALGTAILLSAFASEGRGNDSGLDPRPAIWERLRSRQAAAETAEITWTERRLRVGAAALAEPKPPGPDDDPPEDFKFPDHTCRLVLSGDRVRYENLIPTSVATDGRGGITPLERRELALSIGAFDGTRQQSFTGPTDGSGPNGRLVARERFDEWVNIHLLPQFLAVRPLRPEIYGPSPRGWQIENRAAVVDGVSCLVLRSSEPPYIRRLYLDPDRDYVPRRFVGELGGRPESQVDIRYDRADLPEGVPSSWTATYYFFGEMNSFERSENVLESVTLGEPIADETYTIDYPPGTDLTTQGLAGLSPRMIVAENGEWTPLRQAVANQTANGRSRWPLLLAATGAAALGVSLLLWRKRMAAE
jgi:hypothetical protein